VFTAAVVADDDAFFPLGFSRENGGLVAGTGKTLQGLVGNLITIVSRFAADAGFDVVALPTEGGIAHGNIQGDASDAGQLKGLTLVSHGEAPVGEGMAGLAFQCESDKFIFIGLDHGRSPRLISPSIIPASINLFPGI
jgi:hypothetical protein